MQVRTRQNRAKRKLLLPSATLGCLTLLVTGCAGAIVGDWHLTKAIPNKEIIAIDNAHFARDGTFAAAVTIEGKTVQETGTYDYNGLWLTMRPKGGGQRRYNTVLKGRTFELHDGERKVFLRKGKKNAGK